MVRLLLATGLTLSLAPVWGQPPRPIRPPKEKKEPITQALEMTPDPPAAIAAETARLVFHVSPLSNKGLLTQQIKDALKAIDKANGGASLIKVRAFVAGTGDLRRVQQVIADELTQKKQPLPAISTIQAGSLAAEGAQVVLETASLDRRSVNPAGLAFFAATKTSDIAAGVRELNAKAASIGIKTLLRVTCFVNSREAAIAGRAALQTAYPASATNVMELTRLGTTDLAACEAIGRNENDLADMTVRHPGVVLTNAPRIVFTGLQLAFRPDDADLKLSIERLARNVESVKGHEVVFTSAYALRNSVRERLEALSVSLNTALMFEGLPSLDAVAAIEAIGVGR